MLRRIEKYTAYVYMTSIGTDYLHIIRRCFSTGDKYDVAIITKHNSKIETTYSFQEAIYHVNTYFKHMNDGIFQEILEALHIHES